MIKSIWNKSIPFLCKIKLILIYWLIGDMQIAANIKIVEGVIIFDNKPGFAYNCSIIGNRYDNGLQTTKQ